MIQEEKSQIYVVLCRLKVEGNQSKADCPRLTNVTWHVTEQGTVTDWSTIGNNEPLLLCTPYGLVSMAVLHVILFSAPGSFECTRANFL